MAVLLAFAYSLIIASRFGTPGLLLWGAAWSVIVYRAASKPRNRGVELTEGLEPCD